jgi:hypothetical protein
MTHGTIDEAKLRLEEILELAQQGTPQFLLKGGTRIAVMISETRYRALQPAEQAAE